MRLQGLDLNLFIAFATLMDTRSTTRAGTQLGMSQAAMSAALGRLRNYFGDALLVTKGRRMYPTPFAEMLLPRVRACLRDAEAAIATSTQFDSATAERQFRIIASDYVVAALLAPLAQRSATTAPGVRYQFILPDDSATDLLRRGEVDLLIAPREFAVAGMPTEPIYVEHYVAAGWDQNPVFGTPLTEEAFFAQGHVALSLGSHRTATVGDRQLDLMGRTRRVEIIASSFAVLPWLLIGTHRLALMHERLARIATEHFPIRWVPLPFEFAVVEELAQYHETRANDAGVRWLIEQLRASAAGAEPLNRSER